MEPDRMVEKLLQTSLHQVKVSLQMNKVIWDPDRRGV
jgi:7-carboxy-7-deazaguanine synthase